MGVSPVPPTSGERTGSRKEQMVKRTTRLIRQTKRKRRELKLEAKADLQEAGKALKSNFRSASWWYSSLRLAVTVVCYFSASVALTFYQKDLIGSVPFPLSIVICHLIIKYLLACLIRNILVRFWPSLCPSSSSSSSAGSRNRRLESDDRVVLSWRDYLTRVSPVAAAAAWDIGLSQWSLAYVTVALYTMTKTTCILFIMVLGIVFKLERKHWSQVIIVLCISVGIGLFTHKSTSFSTVGFAMCLTASLMCGLRWTLSQKVMQKSALGLENPIDMIYHIQPLMIISLLPLAIGIEGVHLSASEFGFRFSSFDEVLHTLGLVCGGGVLAFFMEVFEYLIIIIGSSLTLAIIGVVKEIVTVTVSLARNHTQLSLLNTAGMIICIAGITAHVVRKAVVHKSESRGSSSGNAARSGRRSNHFEMGDFQLSSSSDDDNVRITTATSGGGSSSNRTGNGSYTSVPLLDSNDEWSSSEDDGEIDAVMGSNPAAKSGNAASKRKHQRAANGGRSSNWKHVEDEFFLTENRTWTSVKDSHIQAANSTLDNNGATVILSSD